MRRWEQLSWEKGCSQAEVIASAGRGIGRIARGLTQSEDLIIILAGKGHNGDDARGARAELSNRCVEVLEVGNPAHDLPLLERLLEQKPALVIDGLFGIGLTRPLDAAWTILVERLNRSDLPVLAVDVPSGLNADTGEPQPVAVKASLTATLGAPKRGLLATRASAFVGRLEVVTGIGLVPCPFSGDLLWTEPSDFEGFPPPRRVDGHKGTYGHVAICAGTQGYHGAAVLAARGALRAQPGLVSVFCDALVYLPVASQLQAAMVHPFEQPVHLPPSCSAIVIGPGLAAPNHADTWKRFLNEHWHESPLAVIADASALAWIEPGPTPAEYLRVITPHPGEAARLLNLKTDQVQADRLAAVRELSSRYGNCWVVLKGHQTLIGCGSGAVSVNPSGNPFLAQGGSGDVLAGFLGGLLAQRRLQADPLKAIRYAAWKHGEAADRLSEYSSNWTVEDLVATLGE